MPRRLLAVAGKWLLDLLVDAARMWEVGRESAAQLLLIPVHRQPLRARELTTQLVRAGNQSLPLVLLIGLLVGMILELQSAYQLRQIGAQDLTAALIAISITRELAPLLTAILVAGRVGSAITAELATMQVSQEIDALVVMGIDPIRYLVVPRLLALMIALPCLTVLADAAGLLGGCAVAVSVLGLGGLSFVNQGLEALVLQDLWGGIAKATVFAAIIGLVGCQIGLDTRGGAEEVGRSTTVSVVRSIAMIIGADLLITALLFAGPSGG